MCVQVFSYTANKEIRTDDLCLDVSKLNGPVMMLKCHHLKGNQLWEYDPLVSVFGVKYRYWQMSNIWIKSTNIQEFYSSESLIRSYRGPLTLRDARRT